MRIEAAAFWEIVSKFDDILLYIKTQYLLSRVSRTRYQNVVHRIEFAPYLNFLNLSETSLRSLRVLATKAHPNLRGFLFTPREDSLFDRTTNTNNTTYDCIRREIPALEVLLKEYHLLDLHKIVQIYSRILCLFKLTVGSIAHISFMGLTAIDLRVRELTTEAELECDLVYHQNLASMKTERKRLLMETYKSQADYLDFCKNPENENTIFHLRAKENKTRRVFLHLLEKSEQLEPTNQTLFYESKAKYVQKVNKAIEKLLEDKTELAESFQHFSNLFNEVTRSAFVQKEDSPHPKFRSFRGRWYSPHALKSYYLKVTGYYHMSDPSSRHTIINDEEDDVRESCLCDNPNFITTIGVLHLNKFNLPLPLEIRSLIASFLFVGC